MTEEQTTHLLDLMDMIIWGWAVGTILGVIFVISMAIGLSIRRRKP